MRPCTDSLSPEHLASPQPSVVCPIEKCEPYRLKEQVSVNVRHDFPSRSSPRLLVIHFCAEQLVTKRCLLRVVCSF